MVANVILVAGDVLAFAVGANCFPVPAHLFQVTHASFIRGIELVDLNDVHRDSSCPYRVMGQMYIVDLVRANLFHYLLLGHYHFFISFSE